MADERPATWEDVIRATAKAHKVPPVLALELARQESGFKPDAKSPKGALGIMQLMPETAKELGVDPNDPYQNIQGGVRYLKQQLDRYQGDVTKALAAYNAGPGAVDTAGGIPNIPETQNYVQTIMGRLTAAPTGVQPPPKPMAMPKDAALPGPPRSVASSLTPGEAITQSATGALGLIGMDPTTREGRRNLVATAVTLPIGGVAARAGLTGLRAALPVIGGAMAGGAAAETGEQIAEGGPPRPGAIASAAGEQGAYEAAGGLVAWPFKAVGRRLVASKVGRNAADALSTVRENLLTQLEGGLKAAQSTADSLKSRLGMQTSPVPRPHAGMMAADAIKGPAKTAKDVAGRAVEDAAATGPDVAAQPLRERLTQLSEQVTPKVQAAGPSQADLDLLNSYKPNSATGALSAADRDAYLQALKRVQAAQATDMSMIPPEHPLPRVLDYARSVLGDADNIKFAELHKLKRMMDDAVNWDSPAKKQVQQITKGFRQTIRDLMKGHAEYDVATSNYQDISRLWDSKGVGAQLLKAAEQNPESVTKLIKASEPTKLQFFRDLLLRQAAEGGGGAQGEAAWNAVRASWTHENLVRGGIEKLGDRIGKMDPDFQHIMFGDRAGQTVLRNLEHLSGSFKQAMETATAHEAAISAAKKPTVLENALKKSSLGKAPTLEQEGADVLRATFLGPQSVWGGLSLVRLLRGPKIADLVMWSSYSPKRTQMLVSALTNPAPGMMAADLMRLMDLAGLGKSVMPDGEEEAPAGPPKPTAPARAAGAGPRAAAGPPRPAAVQ